MKGLSILRIREQIKECGNSAALILVDFKKGEAIDVLALEKDSKGEVMEMDKIFKILKSKGCHPRMIKLQADFEDLENPVNVVQFKVA